MSFLSTNHPTQQKHNKTTNSFEGVFPAHWRVPHCLLMAFLQQTRQHILETLEGKLVGKFCIHMDR